LYIKSRLIAVDGIGTNLQNNSKIAVLFQSFNAGICIYQSGGYNYMDCPEQARLNLGSKWYN